MDAEGQMTCINSLWPIPNTNSKMTGLFTEARAGGKEGKCMFEGCKCGYQQKKIKSLSLRKKLL